MNINSLPSQYTPYKETEICSNHLIDGKVLFALNNDVPLLVGSNGRPRVWLSIPADTKGETWQTLVRDNKSLHQKVNVKISGKTVVVDTPDGVVLKVVQENETSVKIHKIDLRPFGISIFGNESSLSVMGNNLIGNKFINVNIMVSIGGGSDS